MFGQPNQAFSVSLPTQAVFDTGGLVVSFTDFVHNAGASPTIGGNGNGIFNVGAAISVTPAGTNNESGGPDSGTGADADSGDGGPGATEGAASGANGPAGNGTNGGNQLLAEAFSVGSPYINVIVSYN